MWIKRQVGLSIALACSISFIIMLSVEAFFGSYYEEYQALFNSMLSGNMSPGILFESWYYQGYIGVSYLFARLYSAVPHVEWLGWVTYALMTVAGGIFLFLLEKVSYVKGVSRPVLTALQLVCGFLFLSDHVLNLVNARMVFLMCGASILGMIVLFSDWGSIRKHRWVYAGLLTCFSIGSLFRPEAALAVVLLLTCFSVVWNGNVLRGVLVTVFPLLISLAVVLGILVDIRNSDEFHKQVEPDVEMQYTMRINVVPISDMPNGRDSLRYEAALQMIWGDPKVISVEFLRSLIATPPYTAWSAVQIQRTVDLLIDYAYRYWHLFAVSFTLLVLLLIRLLRERQWILSLLVLLYVAGFFISMAVQTYFVRMTPWSFSPYLSIFIASIILLFLKHVGLQFNRTIAMAVICLIFGVFTHVMFLLPASKRLRGQMKSRQQMYDRTLQLTNGGTLLITPSSFQHFLSAREPLKPFDFSAFHRLYFFESQVASLLPGYHDYLNRECGCDVSHLPNFYNHLLHREESIYCLTTPERADLIERYLDGIHGFELTHCALPGGQMEVLERDASTTDLMLYILRPESCTITE